VHVKAKKITEKLLEIKGHTFRNTTWSKASFAHHAISIILLASKKQRLTRVLEEAEDPTITVLCLKVVALLYTNFHNSSAPV